MSNSNSEVKRKIAIVGAGIMGLSAAFECQKRGFLVDIYEANSEPGGMAAHFLLGEISIEKFYHFICTSDIHTFKLMEELGIQDQMRWSSTKMGYYIDGKLYNWGDPISLLRFPLMSICEKLKYGWLMYRVTKQLSFEKIEHLDAISWLKSTLGDRIYNLLWRRLFELKFYEFTKSISASWIATRIKRIGNSRENIFKEKLGYINGGSETLVKTLVDVIIKNGGELHLSTQVTNIEKFGSRLGVKLGSKVEYYDDVIMTIPLPLVKDIVPSLSVIEKSKLVAIKNIGVVCVVIELKKSVTEKFWLNINDPEFDIPGVIEFSNLRNTKNTVVYIPYYMPTSNSMFSDNEEIFIEKCKLYLKKINPDINDEDFLNHHVAKLKYSQPICEPGFLEKLPPVKTSIEKLQIADTSYYYPEDRGFSESIKLGKQMANNI